jgi:serine/threonine protein kinase
VAVDALSGKRLNQYKIGDIVGNGDISTVYRAQVMNSSQIVAIKVLHAASFDDPSFRARFEREVRILAQIEHPHIVPIYDVGQANDLSYIVMRYLPGGNLSRMIQDYGMLLPEEAAPIIRQVADGLDYTHKRGVLHRNLKPHNILFDDERNAYISDFSLARLRELVSFITNAGYIGNPGYLAPEIATSARVLTPAVDIYALSVILFEALTGRLPFVASSPAAQVMMHVNEPAPLPRDINPDITPQVEMVILRGLAKDPKDRFSTAKELSRALSAAVEVTAEAAQQRDHTPLLNQADPEITGDILVTPPETDNNTHAQQASAAAVAPPPPQTPAAAPRPKPKAKPPRRRAVRRTRWYAVLAGVILLVIAWFAVGVLGGIEVRRQVNQATLSAIHSQQTQAAGEAAQRANETLSAAIAATQSALAAIMPTATLDEVGMAPPTPTATATPTPTATPFAGSGGLIALVSERDGDSEIFILNPATNELTQVTNNAVEDDAPRWSPDGTLLAYHSSESAVGQHIYLIDSDGQNQRQVTEGIRLDSYPQWSADGSTIAYFSVDGSRLFIRSHNLYTGEERDLAQLPPGVGDVRILDWSRDGQTMTIFGFPPSSNRPEIQRLALSTENRVPITNARGEIDFMSFSPDRLLAAYTAPVNNTRQVFLADATCPIINDCVIKQVTNDPYNYYTPRFSPDGSLLLVASDRFNNNLDIYVLDFDGTVVQRLTDSPFDETNAVWQPAPGAP